MFWGVGVRALEEATAEVKPPQKLIEAFFSRQVEEIQPGYSKLNYVFLAKVRFSQCLRYLNWFSVRPLLTA